MLSALRRTLAVWGQRPRELALANGAFMLLVLAPLLLVRAVPAAWGWGALAFWALWAWLAFSALVAACLRIHDGDADLPAALRRWWRAAWRERLGAAVVGLLALGWSLAAGAFWLKAGLPAWLGWPLLGLSGGAGLWAALSLMVTLGVAAEGGRPWREQWRLAALLPLGYLPPVLGSALALVAISGAPVLVLGLRHWSAPLLFAPLLLSMVFTAATTALYLGLLVRGLLEKARGQGPGPDPAWRELWNPWR